MFLNLKRTEIFLDSPTLSNVRGFLCLNYLIGYITYGAICLASYERSSTADGTIL
jgi:hypothetical protein